jgi:hypothetical protein
MVLCGTFPDPRTAEAALGALKREGLPDAALSIVGPAGEAASLPDAEEREGHPVVAGVLGAAGGAAAAAAGVAVGIASGGIALLAAGPIVATIAAGTLGATLGGAAGVVVGGQGIPERPAAGLEEQMAGGKTLLLVECQDASQKLTAERVLADSAEKVTLLAPRGVN